MERGLTLPADRKSIAHHCTYQHEKAKKLIQIRLTQIASTSATSSPEKEPGEIDLTSLSEKEIKTKVITMLTDLQRNMQELRKENTEISSGRTSKQNGQDARDH